MAKVQLSGDILVLSGDFTATNIPAVQAEAYRIIRAKSVAGLDASQISGIDSAGSAFWEELVCRAARKGDVAIIPAPPEIQAVLDTLRSQELAPVPQPRSPGFLENAGDQALELVKGFGEALFLASEIFYWSLVGIFSQKATRKDSLAHQCILLGQNAVPIISLLSFIIGFIIALQVAVQARNFGGGLYLANIMSFSIVRELSPLLTAIIVAGRSGSSIASEIATMQVTQEIDALRMMALNPLRYVVVPKLHAITLMMPILVAFSILLGTLGGILIGVAYLDITPVIYINRSLGVLDLSDLLITFLKSTVFAWLIVIIGCFYGFRVTGGAEGVGKATTSAVVTSIFAVIIADAIFSLVYL